ncbi:hypothetical protein NL676_032043 [Syzygium grande]|nr:hypothetical protein NL676_032043 [Syzygium grande]
MGSALETACGQAYGAKEYHMLGVHMQQAMLTLLCLSIPLAVMRLYTSDILIAFGQNVEISREVGIFNRWMIPSLFAYSLLQCLNSFEYWSSELVVLLSGLLPNPKLETSVLSISLNTCWMVYMISVVLGGAISTRVSNELGAGRGAGARLALRVMIAIAITEGAIVGIVMILVRHALGKLYSNEEEEEVIEYIARMMPLLALPDFLDGFQCVLSGSARGCGWQNLCAWINLGAYYVVAIPCAILFAFGFHLGGMGLWMGIICGLSVQVIALIAVNVCTNWDREAKKAVDIAKAVRAHSDDEQEQS